MTGKTLIINVMQNEVGFSIHFEKPERRVKQGKNVIITLAHCKLSIARSTFEATEMIGDMLRKEFGN